MMHLSTSSGCRGTKRRQTDKSQLMKTSWLLLVLFSVFAGRSARALTVTPVSTTATQAILTYDAPDENPCHVQVSENQSLTPLVHDLDPMLFSGANLDSRPGNLRERNVPGFRRRQARRSKGCGWQVLLTGAPSLHCALLQGDLRVNSIQRHIRNSQHPVRHDV